MDTPMKWASASNGLPRSAMETSSVVQKWLKEKLMVSEEREARMQAEKKVGDRIAGTVVSEAGDTGNGASGAPASAKKISRPTTSLAVPPRKKVGEIRVSLRTSEELIPPLDEVELINKTEREARTPLMTIIQAVLASEGGSMNIGDLTQRVQRYWNRPFPTSPYTHEEFIYMMVRNSGDLRLDE
jgi:hypothetical protein